MKIAIPTRSGNVDDHFGHCEYYTLVSIDEKTKHIESEIYNAPAGCGCKSNVATVLRDKGVKLMLAGNMGQGAVQKITQAGIAVVRGCQGSVTELIENYMNGGLKDSGQVCDHHNHDHNCH